MKIISKFKDYYDIVVHKYGEDPKIVYVRQSEEPPEGNPPEPAIDPSRIDVAGRYETRIFPKGFNQLHESYLTTEKWDKMKNLETKWLVFCGRQFLLHRFKAGVLTYSDWRLASREVKDFFLEKYSKSWWVRDVEVSEDFMTGKFFDCHVNTSKWLERPVFCINRFAPECQGRGIERTGKYPQYTHHSFFPVEKNTPVLKLLGLPSILSAEQAYQELSYFIGNLMQDNPDMKPPVEIDQKYRLEEHGFDSKISFRHRK